MRAHYVSPMVVPSLIKWLPRISLGFAVVGAVLLPLCGLGTRFGLWDYRVGLGLLRAAGYIAAAAGVAAIVELAIPRWRTRRTIPVLATLIIAFCVVAVPIGFQQRARAVPRIHDISTDTADPPHFVVAAALRKGAPNPPAYDGAEVAELQKKAYPDIQPLELKRPPAEAFASARVLAQDMGWELLAADPASGRIEATATTLWFGFKDDVVIRITPSPAGARVDIRSKSRVGRSDLGTNANRVREYLRRLNAAA